MRSETEVREIKLKLDKLTGFIGDLCTPEEFQKFELYTSYANDACDFFSWLLEEISTDDFESETYLGLGYIQKIAESIENRTGKKLQDYQI